MYHALRMACPDHNIVLIVLKISGEIQGKKCKYTPDKGHWWCGPRRRQSHCRPVRRRMARSLRKTKCWSNVVVQATSPSLPWVFLRVCEVLQPTQRVQGWITPDGLPYTMRYMTLGEIRRASLTTDLFQVHLNKSEDRDTNLVSFKSLY